MAIDYPDGPSFEVLRRSQTSCFFEQQAHQGFGAVDHVEAAD
jgi:hypothetical protein